MDYPQNQNQNQNQKQNWKFGFGILAGALMGYWLNSEKGRRVRQEIQTNASEYGQQAATFVKEQADTLGTTANQYYAQGREAVENATTAVKQTFVNQVDEVADIAEDNIEQTETKLKKGVNRARRNVKNSVNGVA